MTRILLVEDDETLAMGLEDDLKLEGHLDLAESFDLIVLDVMLPRKDGFEVCRELRRAALRIPPFSEYYLSN